MDMVKGEDTKHTIKCCTYCKPLLGNISINISSIVLNSLGLWN